MGSWTRARLLAAALLAAAPGCQFRGELPEGARIACETTADCPEAFRCVAGLCESLDVDHPPAVVVGAPARALETVEIPVTVTDFDGQTIALSAEYDAGEGFRAATIEPAAVRASAAGTAATLRWSAAADLGSSGYRPRVVVRVTPQGGSAVESSAFAFGNDAPVLAVSPLEGVKTGDVGVAFLLADLAGDLARVRLSFAASGEGPWAAAAVTLGATDSLAASPEGTMHAVIWDSRAPRDDDPEVPQGIGSGPSARWSEVWLRLEASDALLGQELASAPAVVGPFRVDNSANAPPTTVLGAATPGAGTVELAFALKDAESDPCDLVVEFSDARGVFAPATLVPGGAGSRALASSPGGVLHSLVWDTVADRVALSAPDAQVRLRVAAAGTTLGAFATSLPFTVDNQAANQTPTAAPVAPSGVLAGDGVALTFLLADAEADPCELEVQLREPGGAWRPATGGPTAGLATSPGGSVHTFLWASLGDGVGVRRGPVELRARALQPSPARTGEWAHFSATLDNGLALNSPPELVFVDAAPSAVAPGLYDLYLLVRDAESDPVRLEDLALTPDGESWLLPTLSDAHGSLITTAQPESLASSPQGVVHLLTWDAGSDLASSSLSFELIALRARARDAYHAGPLALFDEGLAPLEASPAVAVSTAASASAPVALHARGEGEVHAFWFTPFSGSPVTLHHAGSRDFGATWSVLPHALATGLPAREVAVADVPGGALVVAVTATVGTTRQLRTLRSLDSGATWGAPVSVTTAATEAALPSLFFEAPGTLHLVWRDAAGASARVWYSRSSNGGLSWTAPAAASPGEPTGGIGDLSPAVAAAGGVVHVAWKGAGGTLRHASSANGTSFGAPTDVFVNGFAGHLRLLPSAGGALQLLATGNGVYHARRAASGAWAAPTTLAPGSNATAFLFAEADGALAVVFSPDGLSTQRRRSRDGGASWEEPHALPASHWGAAATDPTTGQLSFLGLQQAGPSGLYPFFSTLGPARARVVGRGRSPVLGRDGAGRPGALWSGDANDVKVAAPGLPWSEVALPPTASSPVALQLAGGSGRLYATVLGNLSVVTGNYVVFATASEDGGQTWAPALNTLARHGALAVDGAGAGWLALASGSTSLSLSRCTDGRTWSAPEPIAGLGSSAASPSAVWSAGRLRLAWLDTAATVPVVRYSESATGTSWSAPINVSMNGASRAWPPRLAAGPDGTLYALWAEDRAGGLQLRLATSPDGLGWTRRDAGTEPLCAGCLDYALDVDPAGLLTLAWSGAGGVSTAVSRDGGARWAGTTRHGLESRPQLSSDVRGTVLLWGAGAGAGGGGTPEVLVRAVREHHVLSAGLAAPVGIPDGDGRGATSALVVASGGPVQDLGLWLDLAHPDTRELQVLLTPPGGAPIVVAAGGARHWDRPIVLTAGLASLAGTSLTGTWTLQVVDGAPGSAGSLRGWGLRFR